MSEQQTAMNRDLRLPDGFAIDQPQASLGFKVIAGMVRQLQGLSVVR